MHGINHAANLHGPPVPSPTSTYTKFTVIIYAIMLITSDCWYTPALLTQFKKEVNLRLTETAIVGYSFAPSIDWMHSAYQSLQNWNILEYQGTWPVDYSWFLVLGCSWMLAASRRHLLLAALPPLPLQDPGILSFFRYIQKLQNMQILLRAAAWQIYLPFLATPCSTVRITAMVQFVFCSMMGEGFGWCRLERFELLIDWCFQPLPLGEITGAYKCSPFEVANAEHHVGISADDLSNKRLPPAHVATINSETSTITTSPNNNLW